jgi:hypothetical protein
VRQALYHILFWVALGGWGAGIASACTTGSDLRHVFLADPRPTVPRGAVSLKVNNIRYTPRHGDFGAWHYVADVQQVLIGTLAQQMIGVTIYASSSCGPGRYEASPEGSLEYSRSFYLVGYPFRETTLVDYELFALDYRESDDVAETNLHYDSQYGDQVWEPFRFGAHIVGGLILVALSLLWFRFRGGSVIERPSAHLEVQKATKP